MTRSENAITDIQLRNENGSRVAYFVFTNAVNDRKTADVDQLHPVEFRINLYRTLR